MSNSLHEYLRFYRDLGFAELHLPARPRAKPAVPPPAPATAPKAAGRGAAPRPRPAAKIEMPPRSQYRPPQDLFSGAAAEASGVDRDPAVLLTAIQADIGDCTRCRLHEGRAKIVFGVGNPQSRLVFVGEGPGADEDAQGIPFVGRAGQLLTQMINNTAKGEGIPVSRDDVYICNVVKCRPPGNRTPEADEMEICGRFLERQLDAIRPKAICVLGGTAAKYLLRTSLGITKMRGRWQDWHGIPVMPTYHPSFLLRPYAQSKKREAWEDLKTVMHYVYDSD